MDVYLRPEKQQLCKWELSAFLMLGQVIGTAWTNADIDPVGLCLLVLMLL